MEYLCDPVVLSLAWKKTAAYVRRHNWYADTLELDSSGIDLEELTHTWATELASGQFRPAAARLVPAPKNGRWGFSSDLPGGWGPLQITGDGKAPDEHIVLRPLAHLGIREQTAATALLLCLADCVESAQGDPDVMPTDAQSRGVFSYGNRLHCQWSDDGKLARFAWGSADSYSRYYQDYQRFVSRSREVAAALEDKFSKGKQKIYVLKLDLSSFYDGIDIRTLVKKLRKEYEQFTKVDSTRLSGDDQFWLTAERVLTTHWLSLATNQAHSTMHHSSGAISSRPPQVGNHAINIVATPHSCAWTKVKTTGVTS